MTAEFHLKFYSDFFWEHQNKVILAITFLISRTLVVLRTSVASMTSKDMITSLASMTSTASLASKSQKLLAGWFPCHQEPQQPQWPQQPHFIKNLLSMMLPLTWQQNDQYWSLNVEWIIKNSLFYWLLALSLMEAAKVIDVTFNQI